MGCTCKQGVKPVYAATGEPVPGYEEALQQQQQQGLQEAAQSQEGSTSEEQSQAPASQQSSDSHSGAAEEVRAADASTPDGQEHGECTATNPDLTPDEQALWDGWCAEQCGPPNGHPENCLRPEQTGAARCACEGVRSAQVALTGGTTCSISLCKFTAAHASGSQTPVSLSVTLVSNLFTFNSTNAASGFPAVTSI